jgi:hypothetical protein
VRGDLLCCGVLRQLPGQVQLLLLAAGGGGWHGCQQLLLLLLLLQLLLLLLLQLLLLLLLCCCHHVLEAGWVADHMQQVLRDSDACGLWQHTRELEFEEEWVAGRTAAYHDREWILSQIELYSPHQ